MIERVIGGCLWLAACSPAWALDTDIQFHMRARQAQAQPFCSGLMARTDALPPESIYQKAICLLYGLQTPVDSAQATKLLRTLAQDGMTEAQLALADTLQQGTTAEQQDALTWYGRAAAAGDVRAGLRQTRLAGRLQAAADAANAASTSDASASDSNDPYADSISNSVRVPGYHCHMYGLGKKVCHGGMD